MGVFGTGLYSGDFAMDLRSTVGAVCRLPYDGDRMVEILADCEPIASANTKDEDYTTFWLVVADQFAKRGIVCEHVRKRALEIIDQGHDIARLTELGMNAPDLRKRQQVLDELRSRLLAHTEARAQKGVLKKPQTFVMEVGDVYVYPASKGKCINPYFPSKEKIPGWQHDGWGTMIICDRGRAFDYLAWYRPITMARALSDKPGMLAIRSEEWHLRSPGTCSVVHLRRMELTKIGSLQIDLEKLRKLGARMPSGVYQAINDISIANQLYVHKDHGIQAGRGPAKISDLGQILTS